MITFLVSLLVITILLFMLWDMAHLGSQRYPKTGFYWLDGMLMDLLCIYQRPLAKN